jgi:inositol-polyphosphate multikinase
MSAQEEEEGGPQNGGRESSHAQLAGAAAPAPPPAHPSPPPPPPPAAPPGLRPCPHQVAGHLWTPGSGGTPGALVDGAGRFYKPLQPGPRGERERAFYETCAAAAAASPAFAARHAPLLAALPRFHGFVAWEEESRRLLLLALEDVAAPYARPCVLDIKIGHRTWHAGCGPEERGRRAAKDAASTQAALGWKVCGMQVWRGGGGGGRESGNSGGFYWRAGKDWCKALSPSTAPGALARFASAPSACPARVYGGPGGAAAGVRALAAWAAGQAAFALHSASVLILYEGDAGAASAASDSTSGLRVRVRLVDFAHCFVTAAEEAGRPPSGPPPRPLPPRPRAAVPHPALVGAPDANFAAGLAALAAALEEAAAGGVAGAGDLAGV